MEQTIIHNEPKVVRIGADSMMLEMPIMLDGGGENLPCVDEIDCGDEQSMNQLTINCGY
jgi:hypothetical protein